MALSKMVKVQGWIRSVREQKSNSFIDVNDGSSLANLQIYLSSEQTAKYAFPLFSFLSPFSQLLLTIVHIIRTACLYLQAPALKLLAASHKGPMER